MLSELVEAGCIKRWRRSDEGVTSVFLKFQAGLPLPATRTLGLQGRPRLSQLLQRRASKATRYMTLKTKAPSASSSAFISQWCSSGWRCRTLGLTGSLVDGAAPRTTAPVGTFRELLRRGIQVGNKMGVGVCWKIFIFVRFLERIKSADQTWGIWHHLVDRNMFAFLQTKFFSPNFVWLSEPDDWWKDWSDCSGMISGEMPLSPAPLTRRTSPPETTWNFILTTQELWRAPKTQACRPAASSWVSTSTEPSWVKLLPPLTQVSRCLKVPFVSFTFLHTLFLVLRARGGAASGVGPAEVRHPARRRPLRSRRTADPRQSGYVHPGEHRPAGNPQPGGQQGGFSPETEVKEWTNEGYKKKYNNIYVKLIG